MFTSGYGFGVKRLVLTTAALLAVGVTARAQSFSVSDPTRLNISTYYWTPLTVAGSGGNFMSDPAADQQTGQYADDFVGTATNPGFFIRFGQINGTDSVAFRIVENKVYSSQGTPTFTGQASIGMDADGNGSIDIVFTAIGKNQGNGINWQAPGTGANVSPSTTTLGTPTLITGFNASNFDYRPVDATIYPGWTQVTTDPDAVLTFALTLTQINTALAAVGQAPVTSSTLLRFIAFTSTQTNAINQDIYGSSGISGAVRFDAPGGGFTEFTDFTGRPVPEPSTYVSLGVLLGVGLVVRARLRRRTNAAGPELRATQPVTS